MSKTILYNKDNVKIGDFISFIYDTPKNGDNCLIGKVVDLRSTICRVSSLSEKRTLTVGYSQIRAVLGFKGKTLDKLKEEYNG